MSRRMPSRRLFVAIPLTGGLHKNIQRLIDEVQPQPSWRFTRVANLHLTIKFIGNVDEREIHELADFIESAAAKVPPLQLQLAGLGVFPGVSNAKVLWTGVTGDVDPLRALAGELERGCVRFGAKRERRAYRPHITLARSRGRPEADATQALLDEYAAFDVGRFTAKRVILFNSTLGSSGAQYDELHSAPLLGDADPDADADDADGEPLADAPEGDADHDGDAGSDADADTFDAGID